MANATWLVEIRVKDWIYTKTEEDRILGYVEVETGPDADEFVAGHSGFDVFANRVQYEPNLKKRVTAIVGEYNSVRELANKFCAPDAVKL